MIFLPSDVASNHPHDRYAVRVINSGTTLEVKILWLELLQDVENISTAFEALDIYYRTLSFLGFKMLKNW